MTYDPNYYSQANKMPLISAKTMKKAAKASKKMIDELVKEATDKGEPGMFYLLKPEPPKNIRLREDQDPRTSSRTKPEPPDNDMDKKQPEKSVGIYCKYCGRMKEGKTNFRYYDEFTGKPIYYEELNCPGWWCKICDYLDLRGPHIDG